MLCQYVHIISIYINTDLLIEPTSIDREINPINGQNCNSDSGASFLYVERVIVKTSLHVFKWVV